jgi:hypothetical protein
MLEVDAKIQPWRSSLKLVLGLVVPGSVADPDNFVADPDPTSEKPDPDPTLEKNADPDPSLCKILYKLFVTRNFCLKTYL